MDFNLRTNLMESNTGSYYERRYLCPPFIGKNFFNATGKNEPIICILSTKTTLLYQERYDTRL